MQLSAPSTPLPSAPRKQRPHKNRCLPPSYSIHSSHTNPGHANCQYRLGSLSAPSNRHAVAKATVAASPRAAPPETAEMEALQGYGTSSNGSWIGEVNRVDVGLHAPWLLLGSPEGGIKPAQNTESGALVVLHGQEEEVCVTQQPVPAQTAQTDQQQLARACTELEGTRLGFSGIPNRQHNGAPALGSRSICGGQNVSFLTPNVEAPPPPLPLLEPQPGTPCITAFLTPLAVTSPTTQLSIEAEPSISNPPSLPPASRQTLLSSNSGAPSPHLPSQSSSPPSSLVAAAATLPHALQPPAIDSTAPTPPPSTDSNQQPIAALVRRFVKGKAKATTLMRASKASSVEASANRPAGGAAPAAAVKAAASKRSTKAPAAGVKEGPERKQPRNAKGKQPATRSTKAASSKQPAKKSTQAAQPLEGAVAQLPPATMAAVLCRFDLPAEVAEGVLTAVHQGNIAKYITPVTLEKLLRRVLDAGEDLGVSTSTLHTVLRRQPRVVLKQPLSVLREKAAALKEVLGCCSEEEYTDQKAPRSSQSSSSGRGGGKDSPKKERSSSKMASKPDGSIKDSREAISETESMGKVGRTDESKASCDGGLDDTEEAGLGSSSGHPQITLSRILSAAPCLWCYKTETTSRKLETLETLLDLPHEEIQALVRRCPTLLTCAPASMESKVAALQDLTGLTRKEISAMVFAVPQLLFLSKTAMAAKFHGLVHLLGVDSRVLGIMVSSRPLLLTSATDTLRTNWQELCGVAARSARWRHELHNHLAPSTRAYLLLASKAKTRRLHFLLSTGAHTRTPLNSALVATHEQFCLRHPGYKRWSPSQGMPSAAECI